MKARVKVGLGLIMVASILGTNFATFQIAHQGDFVQPPIDQSTPDNAVRSYFAVEQKLEVYLTELYQKERASVIDGQALRGAALEREESTFEIEKVDQQSASRAEVFAKVSVKSKGDASSHNLRFFLLGEDGRWWITSKDSECGSCVGVARVLGKCFACDGVGSTVFGSCKSCSSSGKCSPCQGDGWQSVL